MRWGQSPTSVAADGLVFTAKYGMPKVQNCAAPQENGVFADAIRFAAPAAA